jgi:hypothetical protein
MRCLAILLCTACFHDATDTGSSSPSTNDGSLDDGGSPGGSSTEGGEPAFEVGEYGGAYDVTLYAEACAGDCAARHSILGPLGLCDVGEEDHEYVLVSHEDTQVWFMIDDGRAHGRIDADGSFDASGFATEAGGAVRIEATLRGAFRGRHDGFDGLFEFHAVGAYDGDPVDCHGTMDVAARWSSDACDRELECTGAYPICEYDSCTAAAGVSPDRGGV